MRPAWRAFYAFVSLSLPQTVDATRRAKDIVYGTDGTILEPLPQFARGDEVRFWMEEVEGGLPVEDYRFAVRFDCQGELESSASGLRWFDDSGDGLMVVAPDSCLAEEGRWAWEIEASHVADLPVQSIVHPTLEAYSVIAEISARHLAGQVRGPPDAAGPASEPHAPSPRERERQMRDWARVKAMMVQANDKLSAVRNDPQMEPWLAQTGGQMLDGSLEFPESEGDSPSEEDWVRIFNIAAKSLLRVAKTQQNRDPNATEAAVEVSPKGVGGEGGALAGQAAVAPARIALLPKVWLAAGETVVGWRQRVLTADLGKRRFETGPSPVDDRDQVWLAIANITEPWQLASLGAEALQPDARQGNYLIASKGGYLEGPPPDLALRDPKPRYRISLLDLGEFDGHSRVTYRLTPSEAPEDFEPQVGRFEVARTYFVGIKYGLVHGHIRDRDIDFVTDSDGALVYHNGIPRTSSQEADHTVEPIIGLAVYPYPHDPLDDDRRPGWMRAVPHIFMGWAPTDPKRSYLGLGLEPKSGLAFIGGVSLGPADTLTAPDETYEWSIDTVTRAGWYAGFTTDIALLTKLFGSAYEEIGLFMEE